MGLKPLKKRWLKAAKEDFNKGGNFIDNESSFG
jgi:hypothetical protein